MASKRTQLHCFDRAYLLAEQCVALILVLLLSVLSAFTALVANATHKGKVAFSIMQYVLPSSSLYMNTSILI